MTKGTHPSTIEALVKGITRQQLGKELLRDTIPLGYIRFTVARPLDPTDWASPSWHPAIAGNLPYDNKLSFNFSLHSTLAKEIHSLTQQD
ncbi:hypothetical protein Tco_0948334 [Tanacetum coccineum]